MFTSPPPRPLRPGPPRGGFARLLRVLFAPLFAVFIKGEIEIASARRTPRVSHTSADKQRCVVPRRMKEHKSVVLLFPPPPPPLSRREKV